MRIGAYGLTHEPPRMTVDPTIESNRAFDPPESPGHHHGVIKWSEEVKIPEVGESITEGLLVGVDPRPTATW